MTYKSLLVTMAIVVSMVSALAAALYAGLAGSSTPSSGLVSTPRSDVVPDFSVATPAATEQAFAPAPEATSTEVEAGPEPTAVATEAPEPPPTETSATPTPIPVQESAPEPEPVLAFAPPSMLHVPKIGVSAPVEYVARDELGNMDVPDDPWNVAWYEPGTVPGEVGNAVLAGHVDSQAGPAVFWHLRELEPGDYIHVTTTAGEELTFVVTEVASYYVTDVPVHRLFGASEDRNLNLVTCEGVFDHSARDYDQRRVVYTTLVD